MIVGIGQLARHTPEAAYPAIGRLHYQHTKHLSYSQLPSVAIEAELVVEIGLSVEVLLQTLCSKAGKRVRPGTIVVERGNGTPEFPSLVLPNLASIADGIDVGAAVAIVGLMPLEVALAGLWRSWGVVPDLVAGHSIGEVAADVEGLPRSYRQALDAFQTNGKQPATQAGEDGIDEQVLDLGVSTVVIPRKGKPGPARQKVEHSRSFRRHIKWRTGCEGRVSSLKHQYDALGKQRHPAAARV